jgi:SAM-dependent methyltransferase
MVRYIKARAQREALGNVEADTAREDDPVLPPASVDRILIVDTWHHIEHRGAYAERLARALRPGGFVLVVDFTLEAPEGPPPAMRVAPDLVVAELRQGGLDAERLEASLPNQYVIRGRRRGP